MVSFNLDDLTQPFEQEKSLPGELETVYSDMKGKGAALKKIKESLTGMGGWFNILQWHMLVC
jgi:hypothetical protein